MFNDSSKQFSSDLQFPLWKPRKELVLLKHVPQHTHKEVLMAVIMYMYGMMKYQNHTLMDEQSKPT